MNSPIFGDDINPEIENSTICVGCLRHIFDSRKMIYNVETIAHHKQHQIPCRSIFTFYSWKILLCLVNISYSHNVCFA